MKFSFKYTSIVRYFFILLHIVLHLNKAERRILDGKQPSNDRNSNYVVYLIKAKDTILYDAWLCGGAIVSPSIIITSAACVEDVEHMYAIAGYIKYVRYENLDSDECTKNTKKKIVYTCVPEDYKFDHSKINQWANIDIALVKVEKPYNFSDNTYLTHKCSYIPNKIEINYDLKHQDPKTKAVVFGWGHTEKWRSEKDAVDHNQAELLYGSVTLADKEECKKHYNDNQFQDIIEKYMICSMDQENPNIVPSPASEVGGSVEKRLYVKHCGKQALRIGDKCVYVRNTENMRDLTRRRGICQNDHGGPIVAQNDTKDVLIGVASVFKVEDSTDKCIAPFLYTSTHCNGAFIHCIMESPEINEKATRRCDELARQNGINIIRRTISWIGHPDGPAYNEINSHGGRG